MIAQSRKIISQLFSHLIPELINAPSADLDDVFEEKDLKSLKQNRRRSRSISDLVEVKSAKEKPKRELIHSVFRVSCYPADFFVS